MIQELGCNPNKRYNSYYFCLVVKVALLLLTLIFILGCTPTYIDSGSSKAQSRTIKAVLSECVAQEVGKVGNTNLSLAKGYIRSSEGLLICQGISQEIINNLKED